LRRVSAAGDVVDLQMAAASGNTQAEAQLLAAARAAAGRDRVRLAAALQAAGGARAAESLIAWLAASDPAVRAAAADALGHLGVPGAVPGLRKQLSDADFDARFSAAAALYRMRDGSGFNVLREAQTSAAPRARAHALEATSADIDQAWI